MIKLRKEVVFGVFLGLILIIGVGIASRPKLSKPVPKPQKSPATVTVLEPRTAREILLDAESLLLRNNSEALKKEINNLVSEFPNSYEAYITIELIGSVSARPFTKDRSDYYSAEKVASFNCSADDVERIIKLYGAMKTIGDNYHNANPELKNATDSVYMAYNFSKPDYTFCGLLEAIKSLDLTRRIAVGYESRDNHKKWINSKVVPSKLEWLSEIENKKVAERKVVDENDRKIKVVIDKKHQALSAKFRGVRLRAESGGLEAMFELSEMLRNGIGCETNINESNQWLSKFNQKMQSEIK
jgi:hypothetical protein